ncbi:MAG: SPFH domain-containing protein [Alistipes sp.]|nr:SPFH domain-containing protein [Alistipes sp.]
MENKNFEYSGGYRNGFVMLFVILAMFAASIASFVKGVILSEEGMEGALPIVMILGGIALLITSIILLCGFIKLEPNEARVLLFFGEYRGNFLKTGFWWVNPFMTVKNISLRARNLNVDPIKVNDKTGNPVLIGLVLVWKIKSEEIYRAVFDVDASTNEGEIGVTSAKRMQILENFVRVQSDAALRQVAGNYAYDNTISASEELTLRSNSGEINEELEEKLKERLALAGIEIVEARINYLAYAPEIAAVMLRRQQADAIIAAREKIVEGAVSMVKLALDRLSEDEIVELDEDKKAAMVSNLLVVLCADESAQPVVNTGTLHQ